MKMGEIVSIFVTKFLLDSYYLIIAYKRRSEIVLKLSQINLGETAYVTEISKDSSITRRLLDIGLIPGTKVECVLVSPKKNPKAYMIRGAVIAIRNEDANEIVVDLGAFGRCPPKIKD